MFYYNTNIKKYFHDIEYVFITIFTWKLNQTILDIIEFSNIRTKFNLLCTFLYIFFCAEMSLFHMLCMFQNFACEWPPASNRGANSVQSCWRFDPSSAHLTAGCVRPRHSVGQVDTRRYLQRIQVGWFSIYVFILRFWGCPLRLG